MQCKGRAQTMGPHPARIKRGGLRFSEGLGTPVADENTESRRAARTRRMARRLLWRRRMARLDATAVWFQRGEDVEAMAETPLANGSEPRRLPTLAWVGGGGGVHDDRAHRRDPALHARGPRRRRAAGDSGSRSGDCTGRGAGDASDHRAGRGSDDAAPRGARARQNKRPVRRAVTSMPTSRRAPRRAARRRRRRRAATESPTGNSRARRSRRRCRCADRRAACRRRGSRRPSARPARSAPWPANRRTASRRLPPRMRGADVKREASRLDGKARIDAAAREAGVEREIDAAVERHGKSAPTPTMREELAARDDQTRSSGRRAPSRRDAAGDASAAARPAASARKCIDARRRRVPARRHHEVSDAGHDHGGRVRERHSATTSDDRAARCGPRCPRRSSVGARTSASAASLRGDLAPSRNAR